MKILIITQYYPPEVGAAAERMAGMARFLAERVHVTVLAPIPSYPWGVILRDDYKQWSWHETDGVTVLRTYKYPIRRTFLLRLMGEIQYTLFTLIRALCLPKPDLVIITSPSFFLGIVGLVLKFIRKVDYVFDVRDHYPDSVRDTGALESHFIYDRLKGLERTFYRQARIVSIAHEVWRQEIEAAARQVVTVPNGVDLERFNSVLDRQVGQLPPDRLDFLESHFIVLYLGNMGELHDIMTFLQVAQRIEEHGATDIQFVFLGAGAQKADLMAWVQRAGVTNCHFWDPIPGYGVPAVIKRSRVGIVGMGPHVKSMMGCVPVKVFEYLAGNLDIIGCLQGDLPAHLTECSQFFNFHNRDVDGMVSRILALWKAGKKSKTPEDLLKIISREKHYQVLWKAIRPAVAERV